MCSLGEGSPETCSRPRDPGGFRQSHRRRTPPGRILTSVAILAHGPFGLRPHQSCRGEQMPLSDSDSDLGPRGYDVASVAAGDSDPADLGPRGFQLHASSDSDASDPNARSPRAARAEGLHGCGLAPFVQPHPSGWLQWFQGSQPSSALEQRIVRSFDAGAVLRADTPVQDVERVIAHVFGETARRLGSRAAEAEKLGVDPKAFQSTLQGTASAAFHTSMMSCSALFRRIRSMLLRGATPRCAYTEISYDETPLMMRVDDAAGADGTARKKFTCVAKLVQCDLSCAFLLDETLIRVPLPSFLQTLDHCTAETTAAAIRRPFSAITGLEDLDLSGGLSVNVRDPSLQAISVPKREVIVFSRIWA